MKIAGVILAGGVGARMGAHKPLMPFRGATLIDAAIASARPQVARLALDVPAAMGEVYRGRYAATLDVLPDLFATTGGPLCGVITGLAWLPPEFDWLATFPCDAPFLPANLIATLAAAATDDRPVVAQHSGRLQAVCALWPKSALAGLRQGLEAGQFRSVRNALECFAAIACNIEAPDQAFFNINTKDDLAAAEKLSRTRST